MQLGNATEAQVRFLHAWRKSHGAELAEVMEATGDKGVPFEDLSVQAASGIISQMVAEYGKPKSGKDGDGKAKSYGKGQTEDGGDGNESGDGQGQGEGEGQDGDGSGEGNGDGDGEGEGQNDNDNGGQMENPYRDGSKEQIIAQALIDNDMNKQRAYDQIKDQIGEHPLEFMGNVGGGREPLPIGSDYDGASERTQKGRCKKTINDVANAMQNGGKQGKQQGQQNGQQQDGNGGGQEQRTAYEAELLLEQINKAREIAERMNADGEPFDAVGLRPYVYGSKMLGQGFPRTAIIDAMTMTWPKEVRRELNDGKDLPAYDQRKFPKARKFEQMPLEMVEQKLAPLAKKTNGRSMYLPAMVSLAEARVPIMQVGEKGTGKTTNAEHLAEALAEKWDAPMPFGFASMTSGTSPGEFKGRITLDGFFPALFEQIYTEGGVFLFDELDAGDENLLTLLNSALANGYFVNQKNEVIEMGERFVPVSAANTMGLGANGRYTGRNRLDGATLDRWAMGRIRVDFDQTLAEFLYWTQFTA